MPGDSISVASARRVRPSSHGHGSSSIRRSDNSQGHHQQRRSDGTGSPTGRQRSGFSAIDVRPKSTPHAFLHSPSPTPNSIRGEQATQRARPGPSLLRKRPLNRRQASFCKTDLMSRIFGLDETATLKGKPHCPSREPSDGKICLHTHHHHYWVMSDSAQMQQAIPRLRSSKKRMALQQAHENSKYDGTMDSWPTQVSAILYFSFPYSAGLGSHLGHVRFARFGTLLTKTVGSSRGSG